MIKYNHLFKSFKITKGSLDMKKKILFGVFFLVIINLYALDIQMDVLAGGFYNFTSFSGNTTYYVQTPDYSTKKIESNYNAKVNAGGLNLGFDIYFNEFPFGVYFRAGFMGNTSAIREVRNITSNFTSPEFTFNTILDFGGTAEFDVNKYFSICLAPALSMLFTEVRTENFKGVFSTYRATEDSVLGLGITADAYAKIRYKFFVATAGFAGSFYPIAMIISADSSYKYGSIYNSKAYNLRPYLSIGVTFKEHTGSTISASN